MSPTPPHTGSTGSQDIAWIAGLRAGHVEAFRGIYEIYMPDLWHFARRFVPADVAEDVVQDVMADLWRRRTEVEIRGTLAQYLFGAVHHRVLNHRRRDHLIDSVQQRHHDMAPGMGNPPTLPEDEMVAKDLETALTKALAGLSATQRSVLGLRWRYGMKYEQIANILGISVAAARQHVSRAQQIVRPQLDQFLKDR